MNLLFIGDIVGQPGRRAVRKHLSKLRSNLKVDVVVANAENAAGGFGITADIAKELLDGGIDVLSNGNHAWDKREALTFIDKEPRLLRPYNYPAGTPGAGWIITQSPRGERIAIVNVMGTVFMHPTLDCPFQAIDRALTELPADVSAILVDFHAEATSEKMAMGWHLDGRVAAAVGTHTHVPTADERILPGGCAYISDVGMTGCYDSVIGMNKQKSLKRFLEKLPERSEVAEGPGSLCAVLIEIDTKTNTGKKIQRLRLEE